MQLNKEILDHEVACQMEEPIVQELDAEVKQLRQTIQNYNKQQMSLKALFKELKDKNEAINEKVCPIDLHPSLLVVWENLVWLFLWFKWL